jgi:cytochrome d ubiquinol oxidase subunit II
VFAWSSLVTPIFLGAALGALSCGQIRVSGCEVSAGFWAWLSPFAGLVGIFALTLFALLAAVYLSADSRGPVQDDFRRRALFAEGAALVLPALACLFRVFKRSA